jgi:hypothetical protein
MYQSDFLDNGKITEFFPPKPENEDRYDISPFLNIDFGLELVVPIGMNHSNRLWNCYILIGY